jgi:hypothetical protein
MLSALLKKLIFVRQFSIIDGKIEILGNKHIMLGSDAILELQEIDTEKFYQTMKNTTKTQIKDIGEQAKVYKQLKDVFASDISLLSKKIGAGNQGMLNTVQGIFDIYGLGKMEIISLDNTKKQAVVRIRESSIARSYLKKNRKKSPRPVCIITSAVIAGMFSYLFNKKVDATEVKCLAKGSDLCEFSVK